MDAEKIRNTTDAELAHQLHEVNDELFQLKFRLRMGQTESLKKIRSLRRDLARIKTISRERQLGIKHEAGADAAKPEKKAAPVKAAAVAAAPKAAAKKKTAAKKSAAKRK
jgi:large subunit ribosomal protein L29